MRYSLGDSVAEGGFRLFEKIHQPIFLIHKRGRILRMNEAGRKFLRLSKLADLEHALCARFQAEIDRLRTSPFLRLCIPEANLQLIGCNLDSSDYLLVEIKRARRPLPRESSEAKERWCTKISNVDEA